MASSGFFSKQVNCKTDEDLFHNLHCVQLLFNTNIICIVNILKQRTTLQCRIIAKHSYFGAVQPISVSGRHLTQSFFTF